MQRQATTLGVKNMIDEYLEIGSIVFPPQRRGPGERSTLGSKRRKAAIVFIKHKPVEECRANGCLTVIKTNLSTQLIETRCCEECRLIEIRRVRLEEWSRNGSRAIRCPEAIEWMKDACADSEELFLIPHVGFI